MHQESVQREILKLENVSKIFYGIQREFIALQALSFLIREGEFVSIVGPSGCGKSTILGMVAGLIPYSQGGIFLNGSQVIGIQKDIGYVFQTDALLPWRDVLGNVALPLIFRKMIPAQAYSIAAEWVYKVGLKGFENYYPNQLSGGMRKRVSLAMTLVYNPQFILMDEPFGSLDVQTRNLMENELLDLWAQYKKTILFITHDLEEAISLSDRVIVLSASPGKVKGEYPINLDRPRNVVEVRFTRQFTDIYEKIWSDLGSEVMISYLKGKKEK